MTATSNKSVATLSDVAAKSGMSLGTVSRILRDGGNFREETRRRVLDVAEELNYRPNLLVRAMQTGRTGTVGVAIALGDEFFSRVAVGIHDRLVDAGSLPVFAWTRVTSTLEDESKTEERRQIHRLIERRVDGVILRPHRDTVTDEYLKEVWERNLPLVAIDQELEKNAGGLRGHR